MSSDVLKVPEETELNKAMTIVVELMSYDLSPEVQAEKLQALLTHLSWVEHEMGEWEESNSLRDSDT